MASFSCCWAWLLAGLAAGWLLHWLFDKMFSRDGDEAGARWKRDLDGANAKLSGFQSDLNAANGRTSKLQADFDAAGSASAKLRADFDAAGSASAKLRADLDAANAALKAKTDDAARASADAADLRAKLSLAENQAKTAGGAALAATAAAAAATAAATAASALANAGSFGFVPQKNGEDDIIIIEGIGPKIKELLHADGIKTFRALADAPVARIQAVLDAAGPNFRLANPASWARQAELCARGDWASLRKYQDELNAGVNPDAPKA